MNISPIRYGHSCFCRCHHFEEPYPASQVSTQFIQTSSQSLTTPKKVMFTLALKSFLQTTVFFNLQRKLSQVQFCHLFLGGWFWWFGRGFLFPLAPLQLGAVGLTPEMLASEANVLLGEPSWIQKAEMGYFL